jgi:hypothetical protein
MDFNKLPVELQKEIVYDLPDKSMLVSKNFYNYKKQSYCEHFIPTQTQILNYINKANKYNIPYIKYELKTLSNNIFRIINAADDIIMIYSIDDHIDIEKNNYLLGFKSLFYNHISYDLDLFSLYQLCLDYCDSKSAKSFLVSKMNIIKNDIKNHHNDEFTIINDYIYLMTSCMNINIIDEIKFPIYSSRELVGEILYLIDLLYKYFDL